MRRRWWVVLLFVVLWWPARAGAAPTAKVTIKDAAPSPADVSVDAGGTVTFKNQDPVAHELVSEDSPIGTVPANGTFNFTAPRNPTSITYHVDTDTGASGTIDVVAPASKTTTTAAPTTAPTTTAPTTTEAPSTTAATTTSTSTTTSTTTTTTSLPFSSAAPLPISDSGGGGSSAAPLLALGTVAVAGAAGASYFLWRRSGTPIAPSPPNAEPPTTQGPTV